jgi:hypothetical protein
MRTINTGKEDRESLETRPSNTNHKMFLFRMNLTKTTKTNKAQIPKYLLSSSQENIYPKKDFKRREGNIRHL